jgi:hypothetical protein
LQVSLLVSCLLLLLPCSSLLLRMFEGLAKGYQGSLLPILSTNLTMYDAVKRLDHIAGAVLPTSTRKIQHCKVGRRGFGFGCRWVGGFRVLVGGLAGLGCAEMQHG